MTSFGVVLAGPKAGQADVDWTPVARAMGLDQAAFSAKVLSAMPVLVRRQLDEALATEVAARLSAIGAIAEVVPDHDPFVYIEREGASLGPVPHAALDRFIADGERYRLRNTREWQVWQRPAASPPLDEAEPEPPLPETIAEDVAAEIDVPVAFEPPPPPPPPVDASAFPPAWTQPIVEEQTHAEPVEATPPRSSIAAMAGYLGVFSIIPGVGLLAMLAGLLAVRDIRRHPQKQGIGRARFAIAVGAILSILWAALFVLRDDIRLPPTSQVNEVTAGKLVADRQAPASPRPAVVLSTVATGSPASPASARAVPTPATVPSAAVPTPAATSSAPSPSSSASVAATPAPATSVAAVAPAPLEPASVAADSTGPSFDCKKSLTMTETVICASKALSALDREQAGAFNKALTQASGDRATTLREGQAGWQHERNELCGSDAKCIERYMRARLATFAPPAPPKGAAPPSP